MDLYKTSVKTEEIPFDTNEVVVKREDGTSVDYVNAVEVSPLVEKQITSLNDIKVKIEIKFEDTVCENDYFSNGIHTESSPKTKNKSHEQDENGVETLPIHCYHCDYTNGREDHFIEHLNSHHGVTVRKKRYQCESCDLSFVWKNSLEYHVQVKHGASTRGANNESVNVSQPVLRCYHCQYTTPLRDCFIDHLNSQHGARRERLQCKLCDSNFKTEGTLANHVMIKHNANGEVFRCKICSFNTKRKYSFIKHVAGHSERKKTFQCESCDSEFRSKMGLCYHEKTKLCPKHSDKTKTFQCGLCDLNFKTKQTVYEHFKAKHDANSKEYQCDLCNYNTQRRANLLAHLKSKHL